MTSSDRIEEKKPAARGSFANHSAARELHPVSKYLVGSTRDVTQLTNAAMPVEAPIEMLVSGLVYMPMTVAIINDVGAPNP